MKFDKTCSPSPKKLAKKAQKRLDKGFMAAYTPVIASFVPEKFK